MPDEFVVSSVKDAVRLAREGRHDDAMLRYQALFDAERFAAAPVEDQRQAMKLMIAAKGIPEPFSEAAVGAFHAAWRALHRLVQSLQAPQDHELLGQVILRLGDVNGARQVFEAGLAIAHAHNDSEWAGVLLRRISSI